VRVCVVGSVSIPLLRSAAPARGTSGPIHPSGGGEIGGADPVRFAWVWLAGEGRGWIDPMRVEYCLVGVAAQRLGRVDLSACRSNGVGIRSACLFFFLFGCVGIGRLDLPFFVRENRLCWHSCIENLLSFDCPCLSVWSDGLIFRIDGISGYAISKADE